MATIEPKTSPPRSAHYEDPTRQVPTECEKEPIHIINRIQPCGYLITVNRDLSIVQCSANVVELLPKKLILELGIADLLHPNHHHDDGGVAFENKQEEAKKRRRAALNSVIGKHLGVIFSDDHVEQVKDVIEGVLCGQYGQKTTGRIGSLETLSSSLDVNARRLSDDRRSSGASRDGSVSYSDGGADSPPLLSASDGTRNFIDRSKGTVEFSGRLSCSILPTSTPTTRESSQIFILELEKIPLLQNYAKFEDRDIMSFVEEIARELRKCWSIEEMASLVCSRVMAETPYDRGMVYKFDHEDCGEVVFESFRPDSRIECRKDSYLGLRFPASDIPRQARELFMKNTLRYVYDVSGKDFELHPPMVDAAKGTSGGGSYGGDTAGMGYTDLSMCRLRGSSYVHLKYLSNMGVTSSMTISIIVNKKLWGLYAFHGYRGPLVPSTRTRFLCEMASITTSIVMESLTRKESNDKLMRLETAMNKLQTMPLESFFQSNLAEIVGSLNVNLVAFRVCNPPSTPIVRTYVLEDPSGTYHKAGHDIELAEDVFDSLVETYGPVCRDYGIVYIDHQKSNPLLTKNNIHTLVFFRNSGIDVVLSRSRTVERVTWGGDPDKVLEPDGTLNPRNSFAAYVKDHIRRGKPWDESDRQLVSRFADQLEKYRSKELNVEHTKTILTLQQEKKHAVDTAKTNFDFFAHMAHELRTPFHGILGSLEAMRDDPTLRNNDLLRTAEQCGKSMIKILDDILLVAKGSYNLQIEPVPFEIQSFMKDTLSDMASYALMEGISIRICKEDIFCKTLIGDFQRIRQVINNLVSNAIKFSEDDISLEVMQRRTFSEVVAAWKTYLNSYPACEPTLLEVSTYLAKMVDHESDDMVWTIFSIIDRGIGISGPDLKRLGQAFTQLSSGRQKKYQGTGLGINICNMLVEALGGKLVMFSAKGYGSCFTFAIPLKPSTAPAPAPKKDDSVEETAKKMEELQHEFEALGFREKGVRVLVVDDSAINRKLCGRKIRRWLPSVKITECTSGSSALAEYEHYSSDIMGIFMDYHMHDMDGDECTRHIREYESTHEDKARVYIAGYTADVLDDSTGVLLSSGMDSVIPKPEPPSAVEEELRKMMSSYSKRPLPK